MADYEITTISIASGDGIRRLERAIAARKQDGGGILRVISPEGRLDGTAELLLMARRLLREGRGALQASVRNLPEMSVSRIRLGAEPVGNDLEVRLHLQVPGMRDIGEEIRNQEMLDDETARAAELEAEFRDGRGI